MTLPRDSVTGERGGSNRPRPVTHRLRAGRLASGRTLARGLLVLPTMPVLEHRAALTLARPVAVVMPARPTTVPPPPRQPADQQEDPDEEQREQQEPEREEPERPP